MTQREQLRTVAHRVAVLRHAEEVTHNVSLTCRYCGITRTAFYRWKRRHAQLGEPGLRDRSSRPGAARGPALPLRPAQDRDVPQRLHVH